MTCIYKGLVKDAWKIYCWWFLCISFIHIRMCEDNMSRLFEAWNISSKCMHKTWGSHSSTALTLNVPVQENLSKSDHSNTCGRVPGPELTFRAVSCLLLQTAACVCACAGVYVRVQNWLELLLNVGHWHACPDWEYLYSYTHVQVCFYAYFANNQYLFPSRTHMPHMHALILANHTRKFMWGTRWVHKPRELE